MIDSAILYESLSGRISLSHLANSSIDEVKTQYPTYLPIKRIFDLLFIIALSPIIFLVMAIIAIAIRIEGIGPVIFVQERVGYRNQLFKMYKFRSMSNFSENHENRDVSIPLIWHDFPCFGARISKGLAGSPLIWFNDKPFKFQFGTTVRPMARRDGMH